MKTILRVLLGSVLLLGLTFRVADASVEPAWSVEQLIEFSRAVVTGRVVDISVGRDIATDAIYTYVTVSVADVLKGDISDRTVVLKQVGGELADEGLRVFDQATFTVGEDVLLFLEARPRDGTLYTSALWQGKWTIEQDAAGGERTVARYGPDAARRGAFRSESERLTLASLSGRVRARNLMGVPRGITRSFKTAPPEEELATASRQPASGSQPYVLSGPARWNEFDSRTAIPVDQMPGGQPGLFNGGAGEITRALNLWSAATPLSFSGPGTATRCFGAGPADGHISIAFMDPCGEIDDNGTLLAIGGLSWTTSGGRTVNGTAFYRATAGWIVNNNSANALSFFSNFGCFQATETHELGHVLGLDHSADPAAIMYFKIPNTCLSGALGLGSDDIAGIRSIYPSSTIPAAAPGAPSNFQIVANGTSVTMTWQKPPSGGEPTTYYIESGSSFGLANIANFSTGNTSTSFSADRVGLGTYYVRVRAANAAGVGPASNDVMLVVGEVPRVFPGVPGAPISFVTSAVGTSVTMRWGAPSSGGTPTSYTIESGSSSGLANIANFSTGSNTTSFFADRVGPGTYYVRVRATNAVGPGPVSNESILVVGGSSPNQPGAPVAFSATAVGTSVSMFWIAPQTGGAATSYLIESGSAPGLSDIASIPIGTATFFAADRVGVGTYFVRLRAVNAFGAGPASNEVVLVVR